MTTLLHPQPLTLLAPQLQRTWTRLLRQLARLGGSDAVPARRPVSAFTLVVDGLVDEAWPYVDAVVDATEDRSLAVQTWWRTHGTGLLELRCEVWGSGGHVHVTRTAAGVRCVVQRAPETSWGGGGPVARARADVWQALAEVAATLALPLPAGLQRD